MATHYVNALSTGAGDGSTRAVTGANAAFTIDQLTGHTFAEDDLIIFARGSSQIHRINYVRTNHSGADGHRIVYRADLPTDDGYVAGAMPVITQLRAAASYNWTYDSIATGGAGHIYSTPDLNPQSGIYSIYLNGIWGIQQASKAAVVTWGDYYYDAAANPKMLYIFTGGGINPTTYYGSIQVSYATGSGSGIFQVYTNHTYIDFRGIFFKNYETAGIQLANGSNEINVDYCIFDGNNYLRLENEAFYVSTNAAGVFRFTNCISLRNQINYKTYGNAVAGVEVYLKNCMGFGATSYIVQGHASGSLINYSSSKFFGGYNSDFGSYEYNISGATVVNGGNNPDADPNLVPNPPKLNLAKPKMAFILDDPGITEGSPADTTALIALATAAGIKMTIAIPTYSIEMGRITPAMLNDWANNANIEICSHSYSHVYIMGGANTPLGFMTIKATDGGACLLTIDNAVAQTMTTTGVHALGPLSLAPGATPDISTLDKLVAYLNTQGYTATTPKSGDYGSVALSTTLADVTALDINSAGAAVSLDLDPDYFMRDEATYSKTSLEAMITGTHPTLSIANPVVGYVCQTYVYPGNYQGTDYAYATAVQTAGYIGARGTPIVGARNSMYKGNNVFAIGTSDATSIGATTEAVVRSRIATNGMKSALWGRPFVFYFHPQNYASPYTGAKYIFDAIAEFGEPVFFYELIEDIKTGTLRPGTIAEYVKALDDPDLTLTGYSDTLNAGATGSKTADAVNAAVPQGPYPDIGAYEHSSQAHADLKKLFGKLIG